MELQTYLVRKDKTLDDFGDYFDIDKWDFKWFFGEDRIGVTNNPSTEGESFMRGFLVRKDNITIVPSKKYPLIQRESEAYGRMRGQDAGKKEIYDLIELILGQEITHVYQTRGYGKILTFSPKAPDLTTYKSGIVLPINVDFETAKEDEEIAKELEETRLKRNRILKK